MELNKKLNNSEKDTLELVLKEMLEEQKEANKINRGMIEAINHLSGKISHFDEKLENIKITAPAIDTQQIRDILTKAMLNIASMVNTKPTDNSRKLRILPMMPENSKLFFKVIFGCFLCTAISITIIRACQWGIQLSDNNTKIELEMIKSNSIQKAWNYLYGQKNKNLHRQMDSALIKTGQ